MASVKVECTQCGATEYELLDSKTGEVRCSFCRAQWIIPELVQKSETEKFLEEQAKQPRVIRDNTTETDEKMMAMMTSIASAGARGCNPFAGIGRAISRFFRGVGRVLSTIIMIVGVAAIIAIIYLLVNHVDWQGLLPGS